MTEVSIQKEDLITQDKYVSHTKASKSTRQKLTKPKRDTNKSAIR